MLYKRSEALTSSMPRHAFKTRQTQATGCRLGLKMLPAIALAAGLAGCAQPPAPVAFAPPPPPPVGHPYQVMVQVPPPVYRHVRITPETQAETQQAFNVIALKSALMVAALTCGQQNQYDQFMTVFQPHVLDEQHVMDHYFRHTAGYRGQANEDAFVTLLANNQSVGGETQGAMFCLNNTAEFKQVLALKSDSDLDNFVTDLPPNAPIVMAAGPSVTPLAPDDTSIHVAVIHSSHHVHLVYAHERTSRLARRHLSSPANDAVASTAKPEAVASTQ